jgi:3-vinyl bacteriochlorophyllide hydratase
MLLPRSPQFGVSRGDGTPFEKVCQEMFTRLFNHYLSKVDCCPWVGHAHGLEYGQAAVSRAKTDRLQGSRLQGSRLQAGRSPTRRTNRAQPPYLYSPAERRRRDASPWTLVQGILAPVQFLVFLISLGLMLHYLLSGHGLEAATLSILVKTGCLITIMVTGAIWENEVFGQYLFAPAFFWEDVFSFLVIALHSLYVVVLITHAASPRTQMLLALAAYASYVINASQFLMKLRAARLEQVAKPAGIAG